MALVQPLFILFLNLFAIYKCKPYCSIDKKSINESFHKANVAIIATVRQLSVDPLNSRLQVKIFVSLEMILREIIH